MYTCIYLRVKFQFEKNLLNLTDMKIAKMMRNINKALLNI